MGGSKPLVVLPVDDEGLEIRPVRREEVVYVSREPGRVRAPVTIERLEGAPLILYDAGYGWNDPTRRQLPSGRSVPASSSSP